MAFTPAYSVTSARWQQDEVDVSIEAHYLFVTFQAQEAFVDFPVDVRQVHAVRVDIEAAPPVRVAAGGDPIVLGISAPRAPSRQRLTAIAIHEGPDGALGTPDDEDLGPVPAGWSYAGGAKNPPTLVGGGPNGIVRQAQVTLEAGEKTGASKLQVSFTPTTATRTTASGTFAVQVVAIAFAVADQEGAAFDADPDGRDASGVDPATLELELNGLPVARARWEDRVTEHKASRNGPPIGLEVRFGPSFTELRRGSNVLRVQGRDLAGNPLPAGGQELTYDFPNGGLPLVSGR